jgi:hypothetical protein
MVVLGCDNGMRDASADRATGVFGGHCGWSIDDGVIVMTADYQAASNDDEGPSSDSSEVEAAEAMREKKVMVHVEAGPG